MFNHTTLQFSNYVILFEKVVFQNKLKIYLVVALDCVLEGGLPI